MEVWRKVGSQIVDGTICHGENEYVTYVYL